MKNKVFIVREGDISNDEAVIGIFSTEEKAKAYTTKMVELYNSNQKYKNRMLEQSERDETYFTTLGGYYIEYTEIVLDPEFDYC